MNKCGRTTINVQNCLTIFELSNLEIFMRGLDLKNFTIEFGFRQFECSDLENFS